jgi:uncharacterized membrane protein YkoI
MPRLISRTATTVAALGALALGGSAIAGAATSSNSTSTPPSQGSAASAPAGKPAGRHVGANGKQEQALDAATGAKVKAAALAKVPGATVERVETDVDHGSPYEAHLVKSDGTHLEVLVNDSFAVTAVNTMQQHP